MTPYLLSRRGFLGASLAGSAIGLAASVGGPLPASAASTEGDEFTMLRDRWAALAIGDAPQEEPFTTLAASLGAAAAARAASMAPTAAGLWSDLPLGTVSSNIVTTFQRLRDIALATRLPGSGVEGDTGLASAVATGLAHMVDGFYTAGRAEYNNWFHWEISGPKAALTNCALLPDAIPQATTDALVAAVDHYSPVGVLSSYTGTSTGANRVDRCEVVALSGIIGRSGDKIAAARDAMSPVFPHVRTGDGFYDDGSYIQHTTFPYAGGYGGSFLTSLAEQLTLLAGSTWAIVDPGLENAFLAVERSIAPLLHDGLIVDAVSGRYVANGLVNGRRSSDHQRGQDLIAQIALLADSGAVDPERADAWRAQAKGWLERDTWLPWDTRTDLTLANRARLASLAASPLEATAEEPGHTLFAAMERAVHRTESWLATISMHSSRIGFYETGNGEHLRGWHTGSGMLAWWLPDTGLGQYADEYWCTVDPYRMPGTTVSTKPLADAAGGQWGATMPTSVWSGGTTDGRFASIGQHVQGLQSTLSGRKSWFCLDEAIVCLGAGITARDGVPVETVVDNRGLGEAGAWAMSVDGRALDAATGETVEHDRVGRIVLEGQAGYVFPEGAAVRTLVEDRAGSWRDVSARGDTAVFRRRYASIVVDHGVDPADGSYHYELLPGADERATARRAKRPATVLANSADVQAVSDSGSGVVGANFFAAGSAGEVAVTQPASVLIRSAGTRTTLVVSDPSRAAASVEVEIDRSVGAPLSIDERVHVLSTTPLRVLVDVGGSLGGSHTVVLGQSGRVSRRTVTRIAPAVDAFVRDGAYAGTSYGGESALVVKNAGEGYARRALFAFDLPDARVERAILWVSARVADAGGTHAELTAYAAAGEWDETVTWDTQPAVGAALGAHAVSSTEDWARFDVTAAVTSGARATIVVGQAAAGLSTIIRSREDAARPAFLEVVTR